MAQTTLEQFKEVILDNPEIKFQLKRSSDRDDFIQTMVRMGNQHGYTFTSTDVEVAMQHDVSATSTLSSEELEAVAGSMMGMWFSGCHQTGSSC
jgi:predicted ribosomally synthesized peptide with nif11-like leader